MRVGLIESVTSVFPLGLDGVSFWIPDDVPFCPQFGHRLKVNLLRCHGITKTNTIIQNLDVRIVDVVWILESSDPDNQVPSLVLTVASETPARPGTRQPHQAKLARPRRPKK